MKALQLFFFLLIGLGLGIVGCINPPDLPDTPNIVSVSFSSDITAGVFTPETINDSLFIYIEFEDGDADIGEKEDEPIPFITIEDSRNQDVETFTLNNIEVSGALGGVQGIIQISFKECCCCGPNGEGIVCIQNDILPETDQVQYNIQLTDRAGNKSNIVQSPILTLDCYPE